MSLPSAFTTPILLIVWRRLDCTAKLLAALRQLQPQTLYIACDGPRPEQPGEQEQVDAVKQLIWEEIDWPCQLRYLYSEANLGCCEGPRQAIDWFFQNEPYGIILEDDCLPHPDFFAFCAELLVRYEHDQRVFSIGGSNYQQGIIRGSSSYYFSVHTSCWGWASWRRAWSRYAPSQQLWSQLRASASFTALFPDPVEANFWRGCLDSLFGIDGARPFADAWDFRWAMTCWLERGLSIVPNTNLISNIGFADGSTHCSGEAWFAALPLQPLPQPLQHPELILPDPDADRMFFLTRCNGHALHIEARRRRWRSLYPVLETASTLKRKILRT